MSFWILLWKLVFFVGIALFILMFIFITYKGFFEIKDLLRKKNR